MSRSSYTKIIDFGSSAHSAVNNPLTYCLNQTLDNKFLHGTLGDVLGSQHGKHCQMFLSDYCSKNWDGYCEYASQNTNKVYPNNIQECGGGGESSVACGDLNAGEVLIQNSARKKYCKMVGDFTQKCESFDPTVPNSPMVCYNVKNGGYNNAVLMCEIEDPSSIDNDPVLNKILDNPHIAMQMLVNIYNTMKRKGTLSSISNTRLGSFFQSEKFKMYLMN
jgi:hypothetical protein